MKVSTREFVTETNRIEGILRDPTDAEITEHNRFVALDAVTIADLEHFVSVYQPGARLRDQMGMNVRVGDHIPPRGGPAIRHSLALLLHELGDPYKVHLAYEDLHPFSDGNGRSGRVLWAWQMAKLRGYPLGFLHHFYYQALSSERE